MSTSFSIFAMEAPEAQKIQFADLPPEIKILIINAGVEQAQTLQEAVDKIKKQAQVNKLFRETIENNANQLIKNLAEKFHIQAFLIVLTLGRDLSKQWLAMNEWSQENINDLKKLYLEINEISPEEDYTKYQQILSKYTNLMTKHGSDIIDYLANKFHVSAYEIAFALGALSKEWFIKKGLITDGEELNQTKLQQLAAVWKQTGKALIDNIRNQQEAINLLTKGADSNFQDTFGATALMAASAAENKAIVELLLQKGAADPDIQAKFGWTALHYASTLGNKALVELLLQKGADPNIKDNSGTTALNYASEKGHTKIVQMLEEAMAKQQNE